MSSLEEARQTLAGAEDRYAQAVEREAGVKAHGEELHRRSRSGDATVTGSDLNNADGDAKVARNLTQAAAEELQAARVVVQGLLSVEVAKHVGSSVPAPKVEAKVATAHDAMDKAVSDVMAALAERDRLSDEAGQTLAAAGVPVKTNVGPIRYDHVRSGLSGDPIGNLYNVAVDGEWVAYRDGFDSTAREARRRIEDGIRRALGAHGLKWTTYGVEAV